MLLEADERRGQAKVEAGGVSMWVPLDQLEAARPRPSAGRSGASRHAPERDKNPLLTLTIDLRGQRGDEAVAELSRFLDQAILKGARDVEVIHGRGTGALRREVHEFLRRFPAVDGFRLASEDEGGDGKTLVKMK